MYLPTQENKGSKTMTETQKAKFDTCYQSLRNTQAARDIYSQNKSLIACDDEYQQLVLAVAMAD